MEIRKLHEGDAAAWWRIRLDAFQFEPLAFGKSTKEHRATSVEMIADRFRDAPESTLYLGAFVDEDLVGTATFIRETGEKERHKGTSTESMFPPIIGTTEWAARSSLACWNWQGRTRRSSTFFWR